MPVRRVESFHVMVVMECLEASRLAVWAARENVITTTDHGSRITDHGLPEMVHNNASYKNSVEDYSGKLMSELYEVAHYLQRLIESLKQSFRIHDPNRYPIPLLRFHTSPCEPCSLMRCASKGQLYARSVLDNYSCICKHCRSGCTHRTLTEGIGCSYDLMVGPSMNETTSQE